MSYECVMCRKIEGKPTGAYPVFHICDECADKEEELARKEAKG